MPLEIQEAKTLTKIMFDNWMSGFVYVFSTKVQHDKRLRVEIAYLRTMVESGVISRLRWFPTNEQLAYCFTKISNHAADDLIRYLHEKPAYVQASGPTRSIYGRSKRTPTLLVLLVMYLNMGNMLLSVFILQMNDWWGL